jgi:hypothetical protein
MSNKRSLPHYSALITSFYTPAATVDWAEAVPSGEVAVEAGLSLEGVWRAMSVSSFQRS